VATTKRSRKPANSKAASLIDWEQIKVPLVKLHLDMKNPRHEPVATEAEAIKQLYEVEKVAVLAADIVEQRAMSPLDMIGVIAMPGNPGHYVAVEGNRRMCALLLLNDPDRAPTAEARVRMKELSARITLPVAISVVRFETREEAHYWIGLRHLGPQEGQGLKKWTSIQKSRATDGGGDNVLAVAVLDRAREGKWFAADSLPAVTTLTRYLRNREIRASLGLGHHRALEFTHEPSEVDMALKQFLQDAMPTGSEKPPRVNSRSKDGDRATYAREFRDRGAAPRTTLPAPITPPPAEAPAAGGKITRNRPDPAQRKNLIPSGFICNAADRNLRMLFKEMQRTPIDDHEFANAYLLRAFVERVMSLYLKKVDSGFNWSDDQALVQRCAAKLDPTNKNQKFKAIRTAATSANATFSLHSLGAAVHGSLLKDRKALIIAWENWDYALRTMLDELSGP
jgi:hypothetical protein